MASWCTRAGESCVGEREPRDALVPVFNVHESVLLSDKLVEESEADEGAMAAANATTGVRAAVRPTNRPRRDEEVLERKRKALMDPAPAPAPPGVADKLGVRKPGPTVTEWLELQDNETGRLYYHNAVTGQSRWDKPPGFDEAFEVSAAEFRAKQERAQASYWIEATDSKGRAFYVDLVTHETSWVCPPGFTAAPREENRRLNAS